MQKRSIGLFVVFMLFVPFYAVYWTCTFQAQLKEKTGDGVGAIGHLLLLMFTFGIYYIIWQYKAGKRLAKLGAQDSSVLYVVLTLIGIGSLINPILMQSEANKLA